MKYTFATISSASDADIINEIDAQLTQAESAGGLDKPHHLARAQLLLAERSSRTILWYTKVVAVLTVAIAAWTLLLLWHDLSR
jgi:hypothetical protein